MRRLTLLLVALVGLPSGGTCQESSASCWLGGSVRSDLFVPVTDSERDFNFAGALLTLKASPALGPKATAFAEARVVADQVTNQAQLDLREAWVELLLGDFTLRAGRQIIVWGRGDGINPTDNLNGRNLTVFSPDTDDRRLGTLALKLDATFGPFVLTGVLLPAFRPSTMLLGNLPSNLVLGPQSVPSPDIQHMGAAVKLDGSLTAVDFSVSYFNGFGPMPGMKLASIVAQEAGPPSIHAHFAYDRRQAFGADFAWQFLGLFVLRGEGAFVLTDYEQGETPQIEQPYVQYVLGLDSTPAENLTLAVQFTQKLLPDFDSAASQTPDIAPGTPQEAAAMATAGATMLAAKNQLYHRQQDSHLEGVTLRAEYKLSQEALRLELQGLYYFHEEDWMLRPQVTYAFNDAVTGILGAEVYRGSENALFGQIEDYSSVFAELKYSF